MNRLFRSLTTALMTLLVATVLTVVSDAGGGSAAHAASRTACAKGSGTGSGHCWERSTIYKHLKVVEAVPLENRSRRTATMHCSFSRTITRSFTAGASVTSSAKVSIIKLVDAGVETTLHGSVSQTSSQATTAGGTIRLKPGQRVTCQRTYGYVTSRIKDYYYNSKGTHSVRRYAVTIPAYIGVRIVD